MILKKKKKKSGTRQDSNPRPLDFKSRSLPTRPLRLVDSVELFRLYKHVHLFLTRVKTSKPSNNEFELKISL